MPDRTRPEVERWFIGRGVPHFIDGYRAREDILTRMMPFVGVVFVAEVILAVFGEPFAGWTQAAVVIGVLALVLSAIVATNRVRGCLVLLGSLFLALATQTDVVALSNFDSWHDVCSRCEGSPLEGISAESFAGAPVTRRLPARARFNLALVLFVNQSIQVLLIAAVTFAFYVTFGMLAVREDTIAQWIADGALPARDRYADLTVFGHELVLSRQLLVVAGFITGFAALQFVVQLVTDATYREQFARGMAAETRQVLAVREAYLGAAVASDR